LVLHLEYARLGPAAALSESDVADYGLEQAVARELCQPCIVKRAGAGYRLLDNLHLSVSLRGDVVTQRICARVSCERLIFRHHFRDTGIHHLRHWQPILVIDEPVQKRTKLRLDRSILRTDHRSAHHFWLESHLIDGAKETGRIVQIRAKKQYVRIDLF
jgi:hypothetical protein